MDISFPQRTANNLLTFLGGCSEKKTSSPPKMTTQENNLISDTRVCIDSPPTNQPSYLFLLSKKS